ncbi:uncharacterized protein LOC105288127 isoform X4 [Ooceraea biroi]|uniref:uncharacterized protein LOC105288127 isoform X4 n=1 Tax=Ooceraea biroi TaxID=2015173 RepID=UPI0009716D0E|nr:uncharacterized protein LOC105288127 isoform X4 [Ooceraea biroi]
MSLKRARKEKSETGNARLDGMATTRSQSDCGEFARLVRGAWIGSLAKHWQCKHTRLNRATYVRQCSVRFEVVRGDGVHVTRRDEHARRVARASSPTTSRTIVWYWLARHRTATRWVEYRTSLSVDLLKAGWKLEQRWKILFPAGISADFRVHRGGTVVTSIIPPRMKAIFPGQLYHVVSNTSTWKWTEAGDSDEIFRDESMYLPSYFPSNIRRCISRNGA